MPSGKTHDRLTYLTSQLLFPAAVAVSLTGQPVTLETIGNAAINGAIASLCCQVSGIWLSPDVDCMAHLKHRYGMFRWMWMPYYHACHWGRHYRTNGRLTHRSYLSHSPIAGSLSKLAYLGVPLVLVGSYAGIDISYINTRELLAAAIGLEIGAAAHYVSDWVLSELH